MKQQIDTLNASPSKRLFMSIIADYDLNRSICELVDNGFDNWTRGGKNGALEIDIWLNDDEKTICVQDTAGGVKLEELEFIVGPGMSGSDPTDETIGIFGVGTKRAIVALAKDIRIITRHTAGDTHQVEFDDAWLQEPEWTLPVFRVTDIPPGTTRVELSRLRLSIDEVHEALLREHLSSTYGKFVNQDSVALRLNGQDIKPRFYDSWSYPPDYLPRRYHGQIRVPNGHLVEIEVLAGLSNESSPTTGAYGVYFYCNDRLVAPAMKSFDVGFARGQAGLPHPKISLTKVIVSLKGDAEQMPWNSSKSDISTKHQVFVAIHDWLINVVSGYAAVSRAWVSDWPEQVFKHKEGKIVDVPIEDCLEARRSFLPAPPKSQPRMPERVAKANLEVSRVKPWIVSLYEGVVAADAVERQRLTSANWLSFQILNLTLNAAFKEYLVHASVTHFEALEIRRLLAFESAEELQTLITLSHDQWRDVSLMRERYEHLLFGLATPVIAGEELIKAKRLLKSVLKKMFAVEVEA